MSLALPKNIATLENLDQIVADIMRAMPGTVSVHVRDGKCNGHYITPDEINGMATLLAQSRFVYVLNTTSGGIEPIAAFLANESFGRAQLQHLIDGEPIAQSTELPRSTTQMLGVYIRSLFHEFDWINAVTVPAKIDSLDGLFGLSVIPGDVSTVTLSDADHRP